MLTNEEARARIARYVAASKKGARSRKLREKALQTSILEIAETGQRSVIVPPQTESSTIAFTLNGPPVPKGRARQGKTRSGNRVWFTPGPTVRYEKHIREAAQLALIRRQWDTTKAYTIEVFAYFPNALRKDADNVAKAVLDALNGVLWDDDSQVTTVTAHRRIDRAAPRTEVRVVAMEPDPSMAPLKKSRPRNAVSP